MFTVCGSLFVALSPAALQAVQVPEAELVPNIVRDGAPYVRDVILDTVNLTPESIQVEALEPPPCVQEVRNTCHTPEESQALTHPH